MPRKKSVELLETLNDAEPSQKDVAAMAALPDEPRNEEGETRAEWEAATAPVVETVTCPQCAGEGRIPAEPVVAAPVAGEHALDRAPINSKIVVTEEGAMLAGPSGVIALLKSDPANKLPEGARIIKLADDHYLAHQLNPAVDQPPMTRTSAGQAIQDFVTHFHPSGLHG